MSSRLQLVGRYLWARRLAATICGYMVGSTVLCAATGIDICIPCLWEAVFGFHCPGCGITKAAIDCLHLDFGAAWRHNPLVFIVVPLLGLVVALDMRGFWSAHGAN